MKKSAYTIADKINAKLAAIAPEQRPEMPTRSRAQSVAATRGGYEVTDGNGHVSMLTLTQAIKFFGVAE